MKCASKKCQQLFLLILATVSGSALAIGDELQPTRAIPAADDIEKSIADLSSPDFSRRQAAIGSLRKVSPERIEQITSTLEKSSDNEVIRRLVEVLELHYENSELRSQEARAASEALEKAALSERWFVAEAAKDSLNRHWQRRTELAVVELQALNVSLSPKDPAVLWKPDPDADRRPLGIDPTSSRHLKIYVDKQWPEGSRAFDLLRRLDSLKVDAFMTQPRLVSIYLIDGHPLTLEQTAILRGIFGDTGIAERGRVCLGILNEPQFRTTEGGILVGNVQKDSSADEAGIRMGDLIVAMNGEKLKDFDELVTLLRQFDVGDKITLRVKSFRLESETGYQDMEVTLKGWN